ncbi:prolyl hydroxylase family protein [Altericroceibacterium endophyticum]|uniref:2OG-Fe(II) oxygenase n=1 Tax=Altericroceibacterium endophyticum TaxID=1808508 RepID=A0A6I4T2F3_9SPHN|nr:2OG-Fe(II) oxygenase [Altericroceibacterium endophyticum]MXO64283.1 2OG-Fe(II) oxygenase [Altericroceibacterium endophyticum]
MPQDVTPIPAKVPDKSALARVGAQVRARLQANPAVYKIPTDKAEIYAVGDFLTEDECAKLITEIDNVAQPSATFSEEASAFRTSYSGNVNPHDAFIKRIQRRLDDLLGIDPSYGETVQGQRYEVGQEFKSHYDWFHPEGHYWENEVRRGGQRSITAMVFLNEVEEGGTTDFTYLGLSIDPKPGALLIWNNADEQGVPNEWTMHAGTPVARGVKYIITKWYRTRSWR